MLLLVSHYPDFLIVSHYPDFLITSCIHTFENYVRSIVLYGLSIQGIMQPYLLSDYVILNQVFQATIRWIQAIL